jgi:CubicO group peptidase (beta-lactamase class C family)
MNPAGGLWSTPNDMGRWVKQQLGLDSTVSDALGRAISFSHEDYGWGTSGVPADVLL